MLALPALAWAGPGGLTVEAMLERARERVAVVPVHEAKAVLDEGGIPFVDLRSRELFKQGHVPGAFHMPRGLLEFGVEERFPDTSRVLILYSERGKKSLLAGETLQEMGYSEVRSLVGGFEAWREAGCPEEAGLP
jgi:rhodanese-related sulfurtransferase